MLPFSFSLPQIPLILFAAFYMLYMGFYTLNSRREKEAGTLPLATEQRVQAKADRNSTDYYYIDHLQDTKQAAVPYYKTIPPDKQVVCTPVKIPDDEVNLSCYRISLFSRPPPCRV